jgi:hypothetical protein
MVAPNAGYTQINPLLTRLRAEMEEDMKAKQAALEADMAKIDAEREKRKADMKACKEMMVRREAEKKPTRRRGWPSGKLKKKDGRLKEKPMRRRGWPSEKLTKKRGG